MAKDLLAGCCVFALPVALSCSHDPAATGAAPKWEVAPTASPQIFAKTLVLPLQPYRESNIHHLSAPSVGRDGQDAILTVIGSRDFSQPGGATLVYLVAEDAEGTLYVSASGSAGEDASDATQASWLRMDVTVESIRQHFPDAVTAVFSDNRIVGAPFAISLARDRTLVLAHTRAMRNGTILIGQVETKFALVSEGGPYDVLYVDTNGDGRLCIHEDGCEDAFPSPMPFSINGDTYDWFADSDGDRLHFRLVDSAAQPDSRVVRGKAAPEVTFIDIEGRTSAISDYRGKVLLLYFWGTWCGPCVGTTEDLRAIYAEYREAGFEIVGVSRGDGSEVVRDYVVKNGIPWPQTAQDSDLGPFDAYGVTALPSFVLIDQSGVISSRARSPREIRARIEELLAGPG